MLIVFVKETIKFYKALSVPYALIVKCWQNEPDRLFIASLKSHLGAKHASNQPDHNRCSSYYR